MFDLSLRRAVKRRKALRRKASPVATATPVAAMLDRPARMTGREQMCEHALVDRDLNRMLFDYERTVRSRFTRIVEVLKRISTYQHDENFIGRARQLAREQLGFDLPTQVLEDAWVSGLDLSTLHSRCIFSSLKLSVDNAQTEQIGWRQRLPLDENFLRSCGYHTVDISPCSDGRLQGVGAYVLRFLPGPNVRVKGYAGALFNVEANVSDWAEREIKRLSGAMVDGDRLNFLKIAVYHFSSSSPDNHGCAAHGSNDRQATEAALQRLCELRSAIDRTFGTGAVPDVLLIGVDTDLDALRIHLPDGFGEPSAHRYFETAQIYRDTLGLSPEAARVHIAETVAVAEGMDDGSQRTDRMHEGMRRLVLALAEANLSQIEYVIKHHTGRYKTIGHDEEYIIAGEKLRPLQLRNLFYLAHLNTMEEGAPDMDVGIDIFTKLNAAHGLPVPVLVHFEYDARVPKSRERAIARGRRVRDAIKARYSDLAARGLLNCAIAVSERGGDERCTFVADNAVDDH